MSMYKVIRDCSYNVAEPIGAAATPDGALAIVIAYCEEHQYTPIIFIYQKMDLREAVMVDVGISEDWFVIVNEDGNLSPEAFHIPVEYTQDYISLPTESSEDFECPF